MKTMYFLLILTLWPLSQINGQNFNQEISNEDKPPTLIGKINKEALSQKHFAWFEENFHAYLPNNEVTNQLSTALAGYTITAFMGTWCGDSKKEVPRFYKVLEACKFPIDRLTMIGVARNRDAYKQSPGGEHEGLNIHRVPTFIFYKNGKEVNRIVEHPIKTIEEDMLQLLTGDYKPNYHGVTLVEELLSEVNDKKFQKKQKRLLKDLKGAIKSMGELNTYSSVLFFGNRKQEGIIAARINTLLFPKESRVHEGLANKLYQVGNISEAIDNYQLAIQLDPENKRAKASLDKITTSQTQ
jgi:thiol-disulfide isomerase/thioredoxin